MVDFYNAVTLTDQIIADLIDLIDSPNSPLTEFMFDLNRSPARRAFLLMTREESHHRL